VLTPKPCIILNDRGIPRSDMAHMTMWAAGCEKAVNKMKMVEKTSHFTFRLQANEVPKVVVGTLTLRHLIMRFGLHRVNKVRELDRFLYEENGDVISDDVPIPLLRVKLGGKTTNISDGVLRQETSSQRPNAIGSARTYRTTTRALHCAKTYEHRGLT